MAVQARGACVPRWRLVPGPNTGTGFFSAVTAVSPRDVWAVGSSGINTAAQPLAARWDGTRWRALAGPALAGSGPTVFRPYADGAMFSAVAAVSANDVWAIGSSPTAGDARPFIAHYKQGRWRLASSPDARPGTTLRAIAAVSAGDVWVVGDMGGTHTLAEHWDGHVWQVIPTPRLRGHDVLLTGLTALSAHNIWAVGSTGSVSDGTRRGLVEHWDGRVWRVIPTPQPGVVDDALSAVAASSATNVWAVGTSEGNDYQTGLLVEHWDGRAWRVAPNPALPPTNDGLVAVAVRSPRDVWAAGGGAIAHWDGDHWHTTTLRTSSYVSGSGYTTASTPDIVAMTAVPGGSLWVVGRIIVQTDQQHVPLSAYYDDAGCR